MRKEKQPSKAAQIISKHIVNDLIANSVITSENTKNEKLIKNQTQLPTDLKEKILLEILKQDKIFLSARTYTVTSLSLSLKFLISINLIANDQRKMKIDFIVTNSQRRFMGNDDFHSTIYLNISCEKVPFIIDTEKSVFSTHTQFNNLFLGFRFLNFIFDSDTVAAINMIYPNTILPIGNANVVCAQSEVRNPIQRSTAPDEKQEPRSNFFTP